MSSRSGSSYTAASRLADPVTGRTQLPAANVVPLTRMSSLTTRGSPSSADGLCRTTSSAACSASDGSAASSRHWSGCARNAAIALPSWCRTEPWPADNSVITSDRSSASVSDWSTSALRRSSCGERRRWSSRSSMNPCRFSNAASIRGTCSATPNPNTSPTSAVHSPTSRRTSSGIPTNRHNAPNANGCANPSTKSNPPPLSTPLPGPPPGPFPGPLPSPLPGPSFRVVPAPCPARFPSPATSSSARSPARHRKSSTRRTVNALPTDRRTRWWSSPSALSRNPRTASTTGPSVIPCAARKSTPGVRNDHDDNNARTSSYRRIAGPIAVSANQSASRNPRSTPCGSPRKSSPRRSRVLVMPRP